jgi:hypothetical protein
MLSPNYPMLLSYHGHSEAELVADLQALELLLRQPQHLLPETDRLIDSLGFVYQLNHQYALYRTNQQLDLTEVLRLVQQHFFSESQSCLMKIQAADIQTALKLISHTD